MTKQEKANFQKFFESFVMLHPLYPEHKKEYDEKYQVIFEKEVSLENALTEFTVFVGDGHTNIEIPYQENSLCVNALCAWEEQGLRILDSKGDSLKTNDIIMGVGEESIGAYFDFLESRIPHENIHLVKSRSSKFPYENYHALSFGNYCNFLNSQEPDMDLTVCRDGKLVRIREPFRGYDGTLRFIDEMEQNRFFFTDDNTGVLVLVICSYDDQTKQLLYDFFYEVKRRNAKRIYLDLSKNMGGNSNIINEFLKYLRVDKFRHYQIYERDGMSLKCIQSRAEYQYNNRYEWSDYNGEIICQIGNDTFSSARMFATILRDNGIALLAGEPSGGKPSSCGQPNRFRMQAESGEKINYRISTRLFLRPNGELDEQESLVPDVKLERLET